MNAETLRQLHEKHPPGEARHQEMLLNGPLNHVHPVLFDSINADLIQKITKRRGAAGPLNFDADNWRNMIGSRNYGTSSGDLSTAIARMTKILCTENRTESPEHPTVKGGISALVANRLIPLDKDPGLRPIGIGEVLRRIIGKTVVQLLKKCKLQHQAGELQMSVGQAGGCEAGVHAMVEIFQDEETHGIIQVDANNAFNTINRNVPPQHT